MNLCPQGKPKDIRRKLSESAALSRQVVCSGYFFRARAAACKALAGLFCPFWRCTKLGGASIGIGKVRAFCLGALNGGSGVGQEVAFFATPRGVSFNFASALPDVVLNPVSSGQEDPQSQVFPQTCHISYPTSAAGAGSAESQALRGSCYSWAGSETGRPSPSTALRDLQITETGELGVEISWVQMVDGKVQNISWTLQFDSQVDALTTAIVVNSADKAGQLMGELTCSGVLSEDH